MHFLSVVKRQIMVLQKEIFNFFIFVFQETQLELSVIDILQLANADQYIPNFARHKISIETMAQLTDEDLIKVR